MNAMLRMWLVAAATLAGLLLSTPKAWAQG